MMYLVLAVIFGSLFSIVFKVCQRLKIDCWQVIFINYLSAAIFTLIPVIIGMSGGKADNYSLHISSVGIASVHGILFVLGFLIMDHSVWRSGVALTTVSARASLILPVIFSWIFLAQPAPEPLPVAVVLLAMVLIVAPAENEKHEGVQLSNKTDAQRHRRTIIDLIVVFLCFGISDFWTKLDQHSVAMHLQQGAQSGPHLDALMGVVFISASIVSLLFCLGGGSFKKSPFGWKALAGGLILGATNILCTAASLRALDILSTDLYYPVYNIGIVLIATLVGVVFFKEKVKPVQFAGIALAVLAIILIV